MKWFNAEKGMGFLTTAAAITHVSDFEIALARERSFAVFKVESLRESPLERIGFDCDLANVNRQRRMIHL